jgi:D-glycero-D-manno-heptose 1,7-bisphosphate phosphatase
MIGLNLSSSKAVFLDRDGVLTRERRDYVKTPDELEVLPGIGPPLRDLRKMGFRLVIVTNQSVVGRGLATDKQMGRIHEKLQSELKRMDCSVDAIYYCPHLPDSGCGCRKPEPGLILRAAKDLGIDVSLSWMIGDKEIDLEAARRAGCRGLRVKTNLGDLQQAVSSIIDAEVDARNGVLA